MTHWKPAKMDVAYFDDEADVAMECRLAEEDGQLAVCYSDDGEEVIYRGREIAPGHFELRSTEVNGHATLHRFPGSRVYEGYWSEAGERGFWRIVLDDVQER